MVKKLTQNKGSKAGKTTQKKPRGKGKPFLPNDPETEFKDGRINGPGENAKYTEFHRMLERIFSEMLPIKKDEKVIGEMSVLENMTRMWILSQDFNKQNKALEYYVGKVADELNIHTSEFDDFIKENMPLLTDGQIERLGRGEKSSVIVSELLTDLANKKNKSTE